MYRPGSVFWRSTGTVPAYDRPNDLYSILKPGSPNGEWAPVLPAAPVLWHRPQEPYADLNYTWNRAGIPLMETTGSSQSAGLKNTELRSGKVMDVAMHQKEI
jgi:hypothetical protein